MQVSHAGRKVITTSFGGQRGSGPQRRQGGAEGRRDHNGPMAGRRGGRGRGRGGFKGPRRDGPAPKEDDLDAQLDGYFGRKEEEKSGEEAAGAAEGAEAKKQGGEGKKKGAKKEEKAPASKDDLDAELEAYKAKTGSS